MCDKAKNLIIPNYPVVMCVADVLRPSDLLNDLPERLNNPNCYEKK